MALVEVINVTKEYADGDEKITPEDVNFITRYARGILCAPLTGELADRLELPMMTSRSGCI